jgi:hypothetical protein
VKPISCAISAQIHETFGLSGLIQGISFIFLNRIDPRFEAHYGQFLSNPILYYDRLQQTFGFTIGYTDMVLANHWNMKRSQVKALALVFSQGINPAKFKRTHHKKAYQLSRLVMLSHIYAVQSSSENYLCESLRAHRVEIEKEMEINPETSKLARAALIKYDQTLTRR